MKKLKLIALGLGLSLCTTQVATAAFPTTATEVVSTTESNNASTMTTTATESVATKKLTKTQKKAIKKMAKESGISKGVYILLAILGLGWLGMGLLDNFGGTDWVISLVLYLLFWLPGLIYTLIKMKKYYN